MFRWLTRQNTSLVALVLSVPAVLGVLFSGLGTMLVDRAFFSEELPLAPAQHSQDLLDERSVAEDISLDEKPLTTSEPVGHTAGPQQGKTLIERFEQRGMSSKLVCDGRIMLSVVPHVDPSARPSSASEFKQVEVTMNGDAARLLNLTENFTLSSNCRLTKLRIFEYRQKMFGVEGKIEIGDIE